MPDLMTFAELTAITDQWKQAGDPPGSLLERIKPLLAGVVNLRLFAVENHAPVLLTQTDNTTQHDDPATDPLFAQVLGGAPMVQSHDGQRLILGLSQSGSLQYLLDVHFQVGQKPDLQWWEAMATHLIYVLTTNINGPGETERHLSTQVQALNTMNTLAARLTNTRDENTLLRYVCEAMIEALRVDYVAIHTLDTDSDVVRVVSEMPKAGMVGLETPVAMPLYAELQAQNAPYAIENVQSSEQLNDSLKEKLTAMGVRGSLMVPLYDSRLGWIGVIALYLYGGRVFSDEMREIAATFTAQAGVSLQNIRMLRNTMRQAAQMEQIAGFSQSIQAVMDVPTLLEIGLINAMQIISADTMSIILYDLESSRLRQVAWSDADLDVHVAMHTGKVVAIEGTTAGWVWTNHELLQVDDFIQEKDLRYTFEEGIRSSLSLPIYSRGALTGIVEVGSKQPGNYTDTDSAVFQQLISQLAGAVENAEIYTQSQRLTRSKTLVNEISTQLAQQTQIESILQLTVLELGRALNAHHARIRLTSVELSKDDEVAQ